MSISLSVVHHFLSSFRSPFLPFVLSSISFSLKCILSFILRLIFFISIFLSSRTLVFCVVSLFCFCFCFCFSLSAPTELSASGRATSCGAPFASRRTRRPPTGHDSVRNARCVLRGVPCTRALGHVPLVPRVSPCAILFWLLYPSRRWPLALPLSLSLSRTLCCTWYNVNNYFFCVVIIKTTVSGGHGNQHQMNWGKILEYIGLCVYDGSWLQEATLSSPPPPPGSPPPGR